MEGYAAEGQLETMWKYVEKMYREEGTYPGATTWDVVERTCKSHGVWDQWRAKVARLKQAIDSDKQKKAQERTMKRNQTKFTTRRQTNKKTAVKKKANENQKVVQDKQQK
jgi:pentatricopeptide repeat protein